MVDKAADTFRDAVRENVEKRGFILTKQAAKATVAAVWDEIVRHVQANEKLSIRGFGTFRLVRRPKRMTRNPATGATQKKAADATIKLRFRAKIK